MTHYSKYIYNKRIKRTKKKNKEVCRQKETLIDKYKISRDVVPLLYPFCLLDQVRVFKRDRLSVLIFHIRIQNRKDYPVSNTKKK